MTRTHIDISPWWLRVIALGEIQVWYLALTTGCTGFTSVAKDYEEVGIETAEGEGEEEGAASGFLPVGSCLKSRVGSFFRSFR